MILLFSYPLCWRIGVANGVDTASKVAIPLPGNSVAASNAGAVSSVSLWSSTSVPDDGLFGVSPSFTNLTDVTALLATSGLITNAFTVTLSLTSNAPSYKVLDAVGCVPSTV